MKHHPMKSGIGVSETIATPSSWFTTPAKRVREDGKWWKGSENNGLLRHKSAQQKAGTQNVHQNGNGREKNQSNP